MPLQFFIEAEAAFSLFYRQIGYRRTISVDNGSELNSRDLDLWPDAHDVTLDFSRVGKPTDNGIIAAFYSMLRPEFLIAQWFMILAVAPAKLRIGHEAAGRYSLTCLPRPAA
ncbi:transposase family protein [Leisingera aquaemixtae]|uniref:transposase family protein n=1 Tax=Leisingera aquaemixtae TaxID=1396826 RepID=UPI00114F7E43|nr:transposase family protein [Leisingera aquaemixtae]